MAQVTYRGVTYDTENRPNQTVNSTERLEIYRGIKFHVNKEGTKRVICLLYTSPSPRDRG